MTTATSQKTTPQKDLPRFGIGEADRKTVATILQADLVDLLDLSLLLKQAHWNLHGPEFRAVHLQLDEIVDTVREASDEVAERIVTLGFPAEGMSGTLAKDSRVEALPQGRIPTLEVVQHLVERMSKIVRDARESLPTLGEKDPISEDLVIGTLAAIEKHQWMLRSIVME